MINLNRFIGRSWIYAGLKGPQNFANLVLSSKQLGFQSKPILKRTLITSGIRAKQAVLIKNGQVVNYDGIQRADVLIRDGKIREVAANLRAENEALKIIDAQGKYVMPGGIDPHTHCQMPFMGTTAIDDFYSATRAALIGGTTMLIDFVIPPKGESLIKAYEQWRSWADPKVCCDYSLHMAVTHWNESVRSEMQELCASMQVINSFKLFMAYKNVLMVSEAEMLHILSECRKLGGLAMVHAENGDVVSFNQQRLIEKGVIGPEGHALSRPEEVEADAVAVACSIARETNCPLYVVHVMSRSAADVIVQRRNRGQVVFGEPIAAGLACNGSHYWNKDWKHAAGYVMSPPLRDDPTTSTYLMELLADGRLECTGTDNCTFDSKQKAMGRHDFTKIPNGVNGLEDRMAVIWEKGVQAGYMSPQRFVEVTSTAAARIFNIFPRKGFIGAGADADVVVWDASKSKVISAKTHHQAVDFNIFEGMRAHGIADVVITNGNVVVEDNNHTMEGGMGNFVPNPPYAPYVYDLIKVAEQRKEVREAKVQRDLS